MNKDIINLLNGMPNNTVEDLLPLIDDQDNLNTLMRKVKKELTLPEEIQFLLVNIARQFEAGDFKYLRKIIQTNHYIIQKYRKNKNDFHLAITHDELIEEQGRTIAVKTLQALEYIIKSANTSLVIFGFTTTWKENPVIEVLKKKLENSSITLTIFGDERFLKEFLEIWGLENRNQIKMYKVEHSYEKHSMHAKMALADNKVGLITSANLTFNGLMRNVEIGIVVRGNKVKKLSKLVDLFLNADKVSRHYF